ncbi:MAG: extracellular solute-binding protein [Pseudomonadota bacterium]|jgi:spermidine/putrescine transport system substrate-binding protein
MKRVYASLLLIGLGLASTVSAQVPNKLRILTWGGYVPADVAEDFRKETGIAVEVTVDDDVGIIARLRASGGAGFDLIQPSQDRLTGAQQQYHFYKPIDITRIQSERYIPALLDSVKANTTIDGKLYSLPFLWGAQGIVVNRRTAKVADYLDLCKPELHDKTSMRALRHSLIAFAFGLGKDPFALYSDPKAYAQLMDEVAQTLIACKPNLHLYFESTAQLYAAMRADKVSAALLWDSASWELHRENPYVRFVNPKSGAVGWMITYALPAKGQNDAAAYAWINFNQRPEIAARVTKATGNFTGVKGTMSLVDRRQKAQFFDSFPEGFKNIHWSPAMPAGLEAIEARALERIKAAH